MGITSSFIFWWFVGWSIGFIVDKIRWIGSMKWDD